MSDEQQASEPTGIPNTKKAARDGSSPRKTTAKNKPKAKTDRGRRRGPKPYPVITFQEALRIGQGIMDHGAGHPMKRTTLLEKLKLPVNQPTKDLITASGKYGITMGSHAAVELKLTDDGSKAVAPSPSIDRVRARIKLAITNIDPFRTLHEKFGGGKMPAVEAMRDVLDDLNEGDRAPCVDIFVQNAKFVGILQTREGAEFVNRLDDVVVTTTATVGAGAAEVVTMTTNQPIPGEDYESVCFFISAIGAEDSEHRRHSDAILASYVEKALATVEPQLRVVRADKITQPGLITKQVLEYLLRSRLVVADLSYHNPNVFYELAVRHATGKPVIHIKRTSDPIPFDNKDFRTIDIAFDDKFDILAQIETVRSTIAQFSRQAVGTGESSDNPLLVYFPDFRFVKVAIK